MKPKMIERSNIVIRFAFWFISACLVLFFLYDRITVKRPSQIPHFCILLDDGCFFVHEDGTREKVKVPCEVDIPNGETAVFEINLPDEIGEETWISTRIARDVVFSVDGEIRKTYNLSSYDLWGSQIKSIYISFRIYPEDAGKVLTMTRSCPDRFNGGITSIFCGDRLGIVAYELTNHALPLIGSIAVMFISLILIVFGIFYFCKNKKYLVVTDLCIGVFLVALWLIFDSDFYQLLFQDYYIDGIYSYFLVFMIPYPFLDYIDKIEEGRNNLLILVLKFFEIIFAVVFGVLHFTDICCFSNAISFIDFSVGLIIIVGLCSVIYDYSHNKNPLVKYFVIGVFIFCILTIFEIIMINININRQDGSFILIGLFVLLILGLVQQVEQYNSIKADRLKALAASESKSKFLADMSHEIRTPINSILGMNEMILRESTDSKILEYAGYIDKSGKNLLSLVNDVLDFSKIEGGRVDIVEENYNLAGLIGEMNSLLKERASAKKLSTSLKVQKSLPKILFGDSAHLKQIIINLITNAVKYTEKGSIALEFSQEKSEVLDMISLKVTVTDTGIGIREEDIDKLFESFSRLDIKKNRNIEGTGLGLSIVKHLTETMNGEVSVQSEYSVGSTFTVSIPQRVYDSEPIGDIVEAFKKENQVKHSYKEKFHAPSARILVVDDNSMNLLIVRKLLERTEAITDIATSGQVCLEMCQKKKYDIILMDHMMPEMDGIETLHKLRENKEALSAESTCIVLTANAVIGMKEMYINEGFADYITKPIDPDLLENCLIKYLPSDKVVLEDNNE